MRAFTIRKGKYAGEHKIYDSVQEAKANGITDIHKPWYSKEVQPGYWVEADDGYVIQCLNKFQLRNKRHKSGQYTDTFRFPNGTFYVYYDRNGGKHIKNLYAVAANNSKSSLGNTSKLGKYMTAKKKQFVILLAGGLDPYMAYIKAYNPQGKAPSNVYIQVNKLLNDPLVREELMTQLKPFMEQIEDKVREKTGKSSLVDFLADQIVELIVHTNLDAKEKRANIKLIIDLFGEPLGIKQKVKPTKQIEEADFREIAPPQLGMVDET